MAPLKTNPKDRAHSEAGEKEGRGLVSRRPGAIAVRGKKAGAIFFPGAHHNFTPAADGLSVTYDAQVSDNGKPNNVRQPTREAGPL